MHDVLLIIRSYRERDHDGVVALWNEVFTNQPPWNAPERMIAQKLEAQSELFLVAEAGGHLIGTLLAGYDGVRGWIYHLGVAASMRRRGIGTRLVHAAEAELVRLGCPKINLQVYAANTAVIPFYESLGYKIEERVSLAKVLDAE